jgi:MtrB/PioB family decaheme-associated outer membrane protein
MKIKSTLPCRRAPHLAPIAASIAALCAASAAAADLSEAQLQERALRTDLMTVENSVSFGIGNLSGEHRRFSQYRGYDGHGFIGLLDADLIRRDQDGTWLRWRGRDLGLDTRQLRFDHERQGDWGYSIDYRGWVRREPLAVNTQFTGLGTGALHVDGLAAPRPIDLTIDHEVTTLGARKLFDHGYSLRISFRQDEKSGDRLYGRGLPGVHEFLAEPMDRSTRQWEIVGGQTMKNYQWSAGYAGSTFTNHISRVDIAGGNAGFVTFEADTMPLPQSNAAHQLHLSGGYNFTDQTRSSFKASYELATQDEPLLTAADVTRFAGSPDSLNGEVATTRVFADLTTQPLDRLDLTANLRFEDRDDRTPAAQYLTQINSGATAAGVSGRYIPRSHEQLNATLEAALALGEADRVVAGLEREDISRDVPNFRRNAYRKRSDETTARLELKRLMSESLNGSVAYLYSERGGSPYIPDTYTVGTNELHPMVWADRKRDRVRVSADWLPDEDWSVTALAELSQDRYSGRALGPMRGDSHFASLDASYKLSFRWTLGAWVSQEKTVATQRTHDGTGGALIWDARLAQTSSAVGASLEGRPSERLALALELTRSLDTAEHDMAGQPTNIASLPDYRYQRTALKASGDYTLDRQSGIQAEIVVDRQKNNDWTWLGWTYSDGTTVVNPGDETALFAGVRYRRRWR